MMLSYHLAPLRPKDDHHLSDQNQVWLVLVQSLQMNHIIYWTLSGGIDGLLVYAMQSCILLYIGSIPHALY